MGFKKQWKYPTGYRLNGKWITYRTYSIWKSMLSRCTNPTNKHYYDYGGRGITVCDEWKSYDNFYEWAMANGYADTLTIDRKDNNCGYSPDNCRWATAKEQARNRRNNALVNGKCLAVLAEEAGISYFTVRNRYYKGERDIANLLRNAYKGTYFIDDKSLSTIAKETGINYDTLRYRWKNGLRTYEELVGKVGVL